MAEHLALVGLCTAAAAMGACDGRADEAAVNLVGKFLRLPADSSWISSRTRRAAARNGGPASSTPAHPPTTAL
eukprot:5158752-Pyramimonas_sp.AAC.1